MHTSQQAQEEGGRSNSNVMGQDPNCEGQGNAAEWNKRIKKGASWERGQIGGYTVSRIHMNQSMKNFSCFVNLFMVKLEIIIVIGIEKYFVL